MVDTFVVITGIACNRLNQDRWSALNMSPRHTTAPPTPKHSRLSPSSRKGLIATEKTKKQSAKKRTALDNRFHRTSRPSQNIGSSDPSPANAATTNNRTIATLMTESGIALHARLLAREREKSQEIGGSRPLYFVGQQNSEVLRVDRSVAVAVMYGRTGREGVRSWPDLRRL